MSRPELTFDGCGINGPDEFRTRIATFVDWNTQAKAYGPLFAASPAMLATLRQFSDAVASLRGGGARIPNEICKAEDAAHSIFDALAAAMPPRKVYGVVTVSEKDRKSFGR